MRNLLMPVVIILLISSVSARSQDYSYVGTKNCKKCHLKQFKSWKETNMAKAFEILKPGMRTEQKKSAGLISPVTGDRCTEVCHNEKSPFFKKDTSFEFAKRKDEGTHQYYPLKYKHER